MTAKNSNLSVIDNAFQGWSLNPQEPKDSETTSIVAEIDRAIVEVCVPRNGNLEMTVEGGWTYEMPWHRFPGGETTQVSPICDACRKLFDCVNRSQWTHEFEGCEWATGPDAQGFSHVRIGDVDIKLKCHFCRLIISCLSQDELITLKEGFRVKIKGEPESSLLRIIWSYSSCVDNELGLNGFSKSIILVSKDVDLFPPSFISNKMNSRTSWSLARLWVEHCINNHEECQSLSPADRKLPTRLIDLGPDRRKINPRLCQSATLSPSTAYTTLSHRWGTGKMYSLATKTIEHWAISIPHTELPLTFRHAMEVTKELGCRYLWIDSLCIIQDSLEDWECEAASMGDVYQNSYCNLAAAASDSSSSRGLYNIQAREIADLQMPLIDTPNAPLPEKSECGIYRWFCFDEAIWQKNVNQSPLFKRGWVVQERILSTRILLFTDSQIFWECLKRRACETLPAYIPSVNPERKLSTYTLSVAPGPLVPSPFGPSDENLKKLILWESIVEKYSSTDLTYPEKNKLTALSGIAKKTDIQGDYFAGIWKESLILHLMWHRKDNSILQRPNQYQAPSWSWASVNGQVQTDDVWPMGDTRVTAEVIDEKVDRPTNDRTGRISAGWLKIRAPLARITVQNTQATGPMGFNVPDWNETRESPNLWAHIDTPDIGDAMEVQYRVLMITLNPKGTGIGGYEAEGLLLEHSVNRSEFHRRGLWSFQTHTAEGNGGFHHFLKLFNQVIDDVGRGLNDYKFINDESSVVLPSYGVYMI